jgi:hypothetical protein
MRPAPLYLSTLIIAAAAAFAAPAAQAAGAGVEVGTTPTAGDLDLPLYGGAAARRDAGEDGNGIKLSLWGGTLGFKLAVAKYRSADPVESVAAFYRDALARFGPVLDCSAPRARAAAASSESKTLSCNADDKAETGGKLYKAGTKDNQRVVHVKPAAGGARGADFDLVRLEAGG